MPDEPQICPRQFSAEDSALAAQLASNSKLPPALVRFMVNLDAKMDSILALLQKDNFDEFFPHKLMVTEISASGVLVQSDSLQVGENIELVMFLGEYPPRIASSIGRVLRPASAKADSGIFAIQFTGLRDSDREEVVRFVFKEERERIRSQKMK
jgi:c-di-GMP-binding flagellar brake protein YcgR